MQSKFYSLVFFSFFSFVSGIIVISFLVQENVSKQQRNERDRVRNEVTVSYDYPAHAVPPSSNNSIAQKKKNKPVDLSGAVLSAVDDRRPKKASALKVAIRSLLDENISLFNIDGEK